MKFLAVTDMHYTDKPRGNSDRDHTESIKKLGRAIINHSSDCDFIMNLGDTADDIGEKDQRELLCEVCGALKCSGKPFYSIIGNHDTSIDKNEFCRLINSPGRYYSFNSGGYKCIVLDACLNDIKKPFPEKEIEWDNCNVDPGQLDWLKSELSSADTPVLIFTHTPLMLEEWDIENPHLIKNRDEVTEIIEKSGKVKAVFSGHYHDGCTGIRNGIPHIVFGSICIYGYDTCAIVDVYGDRLKIEGFGLNKTVELKI